MCLGPLGSARAQPCVLVTTVGLVSISSSTPKSSKQRKDSANKVRLYDRFFYKEYFRTRCSFKEVSL